MHPSLNVCWCLVHFVFALHVFCVRYAAHLATCVCTHMCTVQLRGTSGGGEDKLVNLEVLLLNAHTPS